MVNKRILLGILVMVLVFGMTVVGCDDGSEKADSSLNGIWILDSGGSETKLYNGNYEWTRYSDNILGSKGTYTLSEKKITFTQTHHNGIIIESIINSDLDLGNKLYTKNELKSALNMTDEQIEELLPAFYKINIANYFPDENKYVYDNGVTYIRKY